MKTLLRGDTSVAKKNATATVPIHVCMHVLGPARTDVRVMREATALAQAGYSVSVVDVEPKGKRPVEEELHDVCLKHVFVSDAFLTTRFARWAVIRAAQLLFRSTMRLLQTPADIYHAHDVSGLLPCFIVACIRRKQLVFDSHELPLQEMSIQSRGILFLLSLILTAIVPFCAGVITVSSPIAKDISKRYRRSDVTLLRNVPKYQVVPKSDRLRQHLKLSPSTRVVLFQGALHANRSLNKLVHAAPFLLPDVVMVLMGPSEEVVQAELEAIIETEKTHDRVKVLPPVPYEELLQWTASADIGLLVMAQDTSLNVRWCLPNKLFEYLMAGLPVLASQLDAVAEILQTYELGCIVESLDAVDIAAAINAMLADPGALATMRKNALSAAQHEFLWEKESQKLIELYERIMPSRSKS